jgi:hypothetical protein
MKRKRIELYALSCEVATLNGKCVRTMSRGCVLCVVAVHFRRRCCMSQQSVLLTSSIPLVEEGLAHCNDPSHLFHGDRPLDLKADNLQPVDANLPILDSNPTAPSPMTGSPVPSVHDSASVHAIPTVQVTEPQESPSLPRSPDAPSLSDDDGVPSGQRSIGSASSTPLPSPRRSPLHRSAVEVRYFRVMSHFHELTPVLHRVGLLTGFRVFSRT